MELEDGNQLKNLSCRRPALAASLAAVGTISAGTAFIYPSVAASDILSTNRTIPFVIDNPNQFPTWLLCVPFLGALPALIIGSWIKDQYGRKFGIALGGVLSVTAWLLVICAKTVWMLYVGGLLNGFAAVLSMASAVIYIAEISPPYCRGILLSIIELAFSTGMLLVYFFDIFVSWRILASIALSFSTLSVVLITFVPDTPRWLIYKSRDEAALSSFQWLYGETGATVTETAFAAIRDSLTAIREPIPWLALLRHPFLKPIVITQVLYFLQVFCGYYSIRLFLVQVMESVGSNLSERVESLIYACCAFIGSVACTAIIDRGGRRMFLMLSTAIMAVSMAVVAIYSRVKTTHPDIERSLSWLVLTALVASSIGYSLGLGPVPAMMITELFPTRARARAATTAIVSFFIYLILNISLMSELQNLIGGDPIYWISSVISILGLIFIYFYVPETRGRTLEDINSSYNVNTTIISSSN